MPPTLVRPQTLTVFQQPDSASPAVRLENSKLTLWLKDFTLASTPTKNLISLVFEVLHRSLVFAPALGFYNHRNL